MHFHLGNAETALATYREGLHIGRVRAAAHPDDPDEQHNVAISLTRIGKTYRALSQFDKAHEVHQEAWALRLQLKSRFPNHMQIVKGVQNLDRAVAVQQQIGGFDIPVDDALRMGVFQSLGGLNDAIDG